MCFDAYGKFSPDDCRKASYKIDANYFNKNADGSFYFCVVSLRRRVTKPLLLLSSFFLSECSFGVVGLWLVFYVSIL